METIAHPVAGAYSTTLTQGACPVPAAYSAVFHGSAPMAAACSAVCHGSAFPVAFAHLAVFHGNASHPVTAATKETGAYVVTAATKEYMIRNIWLDGNGFYTFFLIGLSFTLFACTLNIRLDLEDLPERTVVLFV